MKDKDLYNKVLALIKLFNSTPYHFANFILENDVLSKNFISLLNNMEDIIIDHENEPFFKNIDDMKAHYNTLLLNTKSVSIDMISDLEEQLINAIDSQNYERASEIRDLLKKFRNN